MAAHEQGTPPQLSWGRLCACALIGLVPWLIGPPAGMGVVGFRVLGVFAATIVSFVLRPMAMGPMVLLGLVALAASKTLAYDALVAGFGDSTVWLVVAAFLIAGAVERTGFGRRIALTLVRLLGRSTLGLAYAICGAELLLGPCVPSNTARGGGIVAPIVQSLAVALDSTPTHQPERAGQFLVLTGAHANLITAAMFLTGMAANPLVSKAAMDVFGVEFGWGRWALGAIVPGLISLGLLPLLMSRVVTPTLKDARPAQQKACEELAAMGGWTRGQRTMAAVFVLLLVLWSTSAWHGLGSGLVAWMGVCVLLLTQTERWDDIAGNAKAWDTLLWLGGLLAMANALRDQGVVQWFADTMKTRVAGLDSLTIVIVLALVYFYSMYGFSMLTAHISAMVAAFFAVAAASGAPPLLTVAVFAYFSDLCACTTNYSSGPVIIYFGLGYVRGGTWFRLGAAVSVFHMVVWLGLGMLWWKLLGWW